MRSNVRPIPSNSPPECFRTSEWCGHSAGSATGAAIASSGGQQHHLTGLWSTAMATKLEELILRDKLRRMKDLAEVFEIAVADWPVGPHDPFININTPQDLAAAESLLL